MPARSWNGWRGWCWRCASDANVSIARSCSTRPPRTGSARRDGRYPRSRERRRELVSVWTRRPRSADRRSSTRCGRGSTTTRSRARPSRRDDAVAQPLRRRARRGAIDPRARARASRPTRSRSRGAARGAAIRATASPRSSAPSGSADLSFSLSHSESLAVVAVVDRRACRHRRRGRAPARAARRARRAGCSRPSEHADWLELEPADAARVRSSSMWTAKEAYLKAIGAGITRAAARRAASSPRAGPSPAFPSPPGTSWRASRSEGCARRDGRAVVAAGGGRPAARRRSGHAADRQVPRDRGRLGARGRACSDCATRSSRRKDEEVAIVQDYSGDPPFADPIVLRLDPDHPEDSIVMVRPWLRESRPSRDADADD